MDNSDLFRRLEAAFVERIDSDDLLAHHMGIGASDIEPKGMQSLGEFVSWIAAAAVSKDKQMPKMQAVNDFGITLSELLRTPMRLGKTWVTVRHAAQMLVIAPMLDTLLGDIAQPIAVDLPLRPPKNEASWASRPLENELGCEVLKRLANRLETHAGQRTLRSLFTKQRSEGQLLRWWPGADTGIGFRLKPSVVPTPHGQVEVTVSRYDKEGLCVRAYEWRAAIRAEQRENPLAVACGMVYVFDRDEEGGAFGGPETLVDASDLVSDTDVSQVRAFLEQHDDAEDIIQNSDLSFVWIWERQPQVAKGAGFACLEAAIKDLRRRFRRMRCTVLSVQPYQFSTSSDVPRPPRIEGEYLEAFERLMRYCESLEDKLPNSLVLTSARMMRPGETLGYLGEMTRRAMARSGEALVGFDAARLAAMLGHVKP